MPATVTVAILNAVPKEGGEMWGSALDLGGLTPLSFLSFRSPVCLMFAGYSYTNHNDVIGTSAGLTVQGLEEYLKATSGYEDISNIWLWRL